MELTRTEMDGFTRGLISPPPLPNSPMGPPPFLQRKLQMGADYLLEVPDYALKEQPGYDPKANAAPYLSLKERRPTTWKRCGQYAYGA